MNRPYGVVRNASINRNLKRNKKQLEVTFQLFFY